MMGRWKEEISSYGLVTVGTFLMAAGTRMVYEPMSMVTGGFAGVGILLRHFIPIPLWSVTVGLNIPLFFWAYKQLGVAFIEKALYGTMCFSLALAVLPQISLAEGDYLLAALLGGALNGIGLAFVFLQRASTGGSDLLASLLKRYFPGLGMAAILSLIDGAIVVAGMMVFGVKTGLYSVVAVFVTSKFTDRILEGLKFAKMLYIISSDPEFIARFVMEQLGRGVTALRGTGMYSGDEKKVLMCAVSRREAVYVIQMVKQRDPDAFVILSDAREVLGEGFQN